MALLGIDVGSTALKAALYRDDGALIKVAQREYAGGGELSPDRLWSTLVAIVGVVVADAPEPARAVAVSSHGESFVAVDGAGKPLGPFILNTADCGEDEARAFAQRFDKAAIFGLTGLPVHSMYTLPKIAWLRRHRQDLFGQARRFLCVEDYIVTRAGVGSFISTSLASRTMGLNLEGARWDPDLLAFAGIDAAMLATPQAPGTPLGRAAPAVCAELGLPVDAIWVAGGHDQGCCALGAGATTAGVSVDGTGTFECLSTPVVRPFLSPAALAANFPTEIHTASGLYLTLAYIAGGVALRWFRDVACRALVDRAAAEERDVYALMLEALPEEPTDLIVFPHLIGTGTPWLKADARGAVFGIGAETSAAELAKAILEGVTLEMQWNLVLQRQAGMTHDRIHAVGGGSRSPAWLQLKADIFGREVVAIPGEASCAGAAMCAGLGVGVYRDTADAVAHMVRPGPAYAPRPAVHQRYREKLAHYQDLANRVYGFAVPPSLT